MLSRLPGDCGIALGETGVLRGDLAVVCGVCGEGKGLGVSVSSGMATFVVILGWVASAVVVVVVGETAVLLVVVVVLVVLVVVVVLVFVMFFLSGIGGKVRKFVDCV